MNKELFIKSLIADDEVREKIKEISIATIDLDVTDMTIGDIIRDMNKSYPANGRERSKILLGEKLVVAILKSKLIDPLSGIVLIFCNDSSIINATSMSYLVFALSEISYRDEDEILITIDKISDYFIKNYSDSMDKFDKFFAKHIYDPDMSELYPYN